MTTVYLTLEHVLEARALALEVTGDMHTGGMRAGEIESILDHARNDQYYPTFERKLTHVFFGLTKGHCFPDGNKRTAVSAAMYMLLLNGHSECSRTFMRDMEEIVVGVAANQINKDFLHEIICSVVSLSYQDDEELKVRILVAISPDDHQEL